MRGVTRMSNESFTGRFSAAISVMLGRTLHRLGNLTALCEFYIRYRMGVVDAPE